MNEFTFFADLFANFDTAFLAAVRQIALTMATAVRTPLTLAVTLYIGALAAMELYAPASDPIFGLFRRIIRSVIVLAAAGAASYTDVVATLFMATLPNELTATVTNATAAQGLAPQAFDKVFSAGYAAGVAVWMSSVGFFSTTGIGMVFLIGAYWILSAICVAVAFLIFTASHILIGLLVATGPIFVCFLLWPYTKRFFDGWLSALLASVFVQVMIVVLLSILMDVESQILQQIIAKNGGANKDQEFAQMRLMIEGGVLFFSMGYLAIHVRSLAYSIMGGAAAEIAPITRMVTGAIGSGVSAGASGASQAANSNVVRGVASSAAAGLRSIIPVGRSLGP